MKDAFSYEKMNSLLPYLVVNGPTDVLQIGVVEEIGVKLLHPLSYLVHANAPDFRKDVPVPMDEHRLEHVRQHILDLVRIFLQFFAPGH